MEGHLGKVSAFTSIVSIEPELDTAVYAAGDVFFGLTAIPAFRLQTGTGLLLNITGVDKDDVAPAFDILLFKSSTVSVGGQNTIWAVSDADMASHCLGVVSIVATDWIDLGGNRVLSKTNLNIPVMDGQTASNLYIAAVARAATTHSSAGLTLKFGFIQD